MSVEIALVPPRCNRARDLFLAAAASVVDGTCIGAPSSAWLDDDTDRSEWTEEDVVWLHWRLLKELGQLADPSTPLAEKIDTLDWVLSDASHDGQPFSLARCVRVAGLSPLSPIAYVGLIDADAVRDYVRRHVRVWLRQTIARYPAWVQQLVLARPQWVAAQLGKNDQWLNEQIVKARADEVAQAGLFGIEAEPCAAERCT